MHARVLRRVVDLHAEALGGVPDPARVVEQRARQAICRRRRTAGRSRPARDRRSCPPTRVVMPASLRMLAANGTLIARLHLHFLLRHQRAARDADEVEADASSVRARTPPPPPISKPPSTQSVPLMRRRARAPSARPRAARAPPRAGISSGPCRRRRCACWKAATGTGAAGSRAPRAARPGRSRCAWRAAPRRRRHRPAPRSSATDNSCGTCQPSPNASRGRRDRRPGRFAGAERLAAQPRAPARRPCARRAPIWMPIGERVMRRGRPAPRSIAASLWSLYRPVQPCVMRPSRVTLVFSTMNRPAPEQAMLPRCARCQSVIEPSSAEYWHIGAMTAMRLGSVMPPSWRGSNSLGSDNGDSFLGEYLAQGLREQSRRRAGRRAGTAYRRRPATRLPLRLVT